MPHKVNPIDFENAEGNYGLSNSLLLHLANKLPISRLQRDLSDSSVLRSLGAAIGYHYLSQQSLKIGLSKLYANKEAIERDLADQWMLLAEPIQMMLRKYGTIDAYERLKCLTRGQVVNEKDMKNLINSLDISEEDKNNLLSLSPLSYTGLGIKVVNECFEKIDLRALFH